MANKAVLLGRLGKDPEMTYTASGMAMTKFSLATSESFTDKQSGEKRENTEWHNIVAWGKNAETIRQYVAKGQQLYIEGKIHYNKWQDKDGNNRISTEIVVDRFEFVGKKEGGNKAEGAPKTDKLPLGDDDIPF